MKIKAGARSVVTGAAGGFGRALALELAGRFQDPETQKTAEKFVARGRAPEVIARRALRAVEKNRRYCLPMLDARLGWVLKRIFPNSMGRLFHWLEKIDAALK